MLIELVIFVTIYIHSSQSCIPKIVQVIKGEIYYIGLFSINITENQPDIIKSEAYSNHIFLTNSVLGSIIYTSNIPFGYTAYDICDNETVMKQTLLSLLLDEEFNFQYGTMIGKSSRIAAIFTHLSVKLTKLLINYFSFEDIPIVSQLDKTQIFNYSKDSMPFYIPKNRDLTSTHIMNTVKVPNPNHVFVACLTKEEYLQQLCKEVIEKLSNEMNSCFSVIQMYTKQYMNRLVTSLASRNENQTTLVIIGNDEDQESLIIEMLKQKVYYRNILSYGLSNDYWHNKLHKLFLTQIVKDKFKDFITFTNTKKRKFYAWNLKLNSTDLLANDFHMNISDLSTIKTSLFLLDGRINDCNLIFDYCIDILPRLNCWIKTTKKFVSSCIKNHTTYTVFWFLFKHAGPVIMYNKVILFEYTTLSTEIIGNLTCNKIICKSSYEAIPTKRLDVEANELLNITKEWECKQCQVNFIQPNDNTNSSCTKCPFFFISNSNNTECVDPYIEKYLSLQNHNVYIPISIALISLMMILTTVVVYIKFPEAKVIIASNKRMTILQISVFLLFFILFPMFMIGKPSYIKCLARPMLFGYTCNIVSSIILVKTNKLLKIFNADLRFTKNEIRNSKIVDVMIIIIFIILESILNFLCVVTMPTKVIQVLNEVNKERNIFCDNNQYFVIHFVIIFISSFWSLVQCFRIRNLPRLFNEAKEILNATLIADFVIALTLFIYYSRSTEYEQDYVILLMLPIMVGSFYLFLFYKKMLLLFQCKRMNTNN